VGRNLHAVLQALDVLEGEEGEHPEELGDVGIGGAGQQVLVELEGGQPICKEDGSNVSEPEWRQRLASGEVAFCQVLMSSHVVSLMRTSIDAGETSIVLESI